jgi:hypothetical protein
MVKVHGEIPHVWTIFEPSILCFIRFSHQLKAWILVPGIRHERCDQKKLVVSCWFFKPPKWAESKQK